MLAGLEGKAGFQDGRGTHALFNSPTGLCLSPLGVLVVADADNSCIRQVTTTGESREWGLAGLCLGRRRCCQRCFNDKGKPAVATCTHGAVARP